MNEKSNIYGGLRGTFNNEESPSSEKHESNLLTPVSTFRTTFASVSLHMTDRIRLLRFPQSDVSDIQNLVRSSWQRGIQDLRVYDQSNEIKLCGNPWSQNYGDQRTEARRLVKGLLQGLFDMGWILRAAVDISKKEFDKGRPD